MPLLKAHDDKLASCTQQQYHIIQPDRIFAAGCKKNILSLSFDPVFCLARVLTLPFFTDEMQMQSCRHPLLFVCTQQRQQQQMLPGSFLFQPRARSGLNSGGQRAARTTAAHGSHSGSEPRGPLLAAREPNNGRKSERRAGDHSRATRAAALPAALLARSASASASSAEKRLALVLGGLEVGADGLPVDDAPERGDVLGAAVLVLEVVGVLLL